MFRTARGHGDKRSNSGRRLDISPVRRGCRAATAKAFSICRAAGCSAPVSLPVANGVVDLLTGEVMFVSTHANGQDALIPAIRGPAVEPTRSRRRPGIRRTHTEPPGSDLQERFVAALSIVEFRKKRSRAGLVNVPTASSRQVVEQRLRILQIGGVEALGEPAENGCEKLVRLCAPALLPPQPGETRRGAQLP